jgi:hypothetical protein
MASERKPGPLGRIPEAQDLNDGTLFRGRSPLPGPIGVRPTATHGSLITANTSDLNHLLWQMRAASHGMATTIDRDLLLRALREALKPIAPDIDLDRLLQLLRDGGDLIALQKITHILFGGVCFNAGVIVGIGKQIISDAVDMIKLSWTLLLADLHDIYNKSKFRKLTMLGPNELPRLLVAEAAGLLFPDKLREAAEERNALINEITEALKHPLDLAVGIAKDVWEGLQRDWQEYSNHMQAGTLEGEFKAGMIFGKVLVAVIGCIYAAAKLAKLPRLFKLARGFMKKPDIPDMNKLSDMDGGGQDVGGATPPDPTRPRPPRKARDDREIPEHTSARSGRVSKEELRRVRQQHPDLYAKYRKELEKNNPEAKSTMSEMRAIALVKRQKSTAGLVAGENECADFLNVPRKTKMVDIVKTENSGLRVPIEVKNEETLSLGSKGNNALSKFENIANHTDMNQISHFEIIADTKSKLPGNFRVNNQGTLERLISEKDGWKRVEYGGKEVRVHRAPIDD